MTDADLAALEQRVTEKLAAAMPKWDLPEVAPLPDFSKVPPLPEGWPEFPHPRWMVYPARRAYALTLADRLIDMGQLSEAGLLIAIGGKERTS